VLIDVEKHILPAIINDYLCCIQVDLETLADPDNTNEVDHESLYQISCLLGKNSYDKFEFKIDVKEKLKAHFLKVLKAQINEEKEMNQPQGNNGRSQRNDSMQSANVYKPSPSEQTYILSQKIEEELEKLTIERFISSSHFVFTADPVSVKTRKFLQQYPSITKSLHYSWFEEKQLLVDQTLYTIS